MFSKRVWLAAVVLVCILALVAVAIVQAQTGQRPPNRPGGQRPVMDVQMCPVRVFGPPPAQMMQRLATELQLTDRQQKQATEMVGALDTRIKQITSAGNPMKDLIGELKSEDTKADKVRELGAQVSKQEAEILQAELAMWVKYEQMLTPEQRTKFWAIFPRQPGPMGPPPGMMPGGPGVPGAPNQPPQAPPPGN